MLFPHGLLYEKTISSSFCKFCECLWPCRRICQFLFNFSNFTTLFHTQLLNSAKMANLRAKLVTYTTVAVILVLDVRICGKLKTALFMATKIG